MGSTGRLPVRHICRCVYGAVRRSSGLEEPVLPHSTAWRHAVLCLPHTAVESMCAVPLRRGQCHPHPGSGVLVRHCYGSKHQTLQLCWVTVCSSISGRWDILFLLWAQLCADRSVVCNNSMVGSLYFVLHEALPFPQSADQQTMFIQGEGTTPGANPSGILSHSSSASTLAPFTHSQCFYLAIQCS